MIFLQARIPPALPEIPAHPTEAKLLLRFHREPWAGLRGKSLAQTTGAAGGKMHRQPERLSQYPDRSGTGHGDPQRGQPLSERFMTRTCGCGNCCRIWLPAKGSSSGSPNPTAMHNKKLRNHRGGSGVFSMYQSYQPMAKVSSAVAAISSPTLATAVPMPTLPKVRVMVVSRVSTSPGLT